MFKCINKLLIIANVLGVVLMWHTAIKKAVINASPETLIEGYVPLDAYESAINRCMYKHYCLISLNLYFHTIFYIPQKLFTQGTTSTSDIILIGTKTQL